MATAKTIKSHISCSVCFNVYTDPHALVCLHTFCKPCIDRITVSHSVECPHCRETCLVNNIRKDFKTQALIDDNSGGNRSDRPTDSYNCEVCDSDCVVIFCADCDQYMCKACGLAHSKIKLTKHHKPTPVETIIKSAKEKATAALKVWKDEACKVTDNITALDTTLLKLQKDVNTQIEEVESHISKLIEGLQKQKDDHIQLIKDANVSIENNLLKRKQYAEELQKTIINKINVYESVKDLRTMHEMDRKIPVNLQKDIDALATQSIANDYSTNTCVDIGQNSTADAKIKIRIITKDISKSSDNASIDYSKFINSSYGIKNTKVFTGEEITSMCLIGNELWCCQKQDGVVVYDCDTLEFIRNISTPGQASAVTQAHNGDIIVACDKNGGLQEIIKINKRPYTNVTITAGNFIDVVRFKDQLFAFGYNVRKNMIKIYDWQKCVWTIIKEIEAPFNHLYMTALKVYDDKMYISHKNGTLSHGIAEVDKNGSILEIFGSRGYSLPGELNNPIISDIDTNGKALVVDSNNERLQVLDTQSGHWDVAEISAVLKNRPLAVTVANGGRNIWISSRLLTTGGNHSKIMQKWIQKW